jgi:hypothetical protein
VWATVLKGHALANGIPESKLKGSRPVLEIKQSPASGFYSTAKARNSASNSVTGAAVDQNAEQSASRDGPSRQPT